MCLEHTSRRLAYFLQSPGHLHLPRPESAQQRVVVLCYMQGGSSAIVGRMHVGPPFRSIRAHSARRSDCSAFPVAANSTSNPLAKKVCRSFNGICDRMLLD
jgi:hypothetical protein